MKKLITTFCLTAMALVGYSQTCFWHENMEVIDSVTASPNATDWAQNTRIANSGIACDSGQVQVGTTTYLESNTFDLTGQFFAILSFYHIGRLDFFDAATVEVSNDGGVNWSQLTCQEFDSTLVDYPAFCGQANTFSSATTLDWAPGVPATVADNSMWHFARFDISALVGNQANVKLRFKLEDRNGGGSGGYPGWFIDDVCVNAAPCELNPPTIALSTPVLQGTVYNLGPFDVNATITDGSGILSANITYYVNGVLQNTSPMTIVGPDLYNATIPAVNDGDTVCYSITAVDNSGCANASSYPVTGCVQFIASTGITFPYCDNFDINQLWTDTVVTGTPWQLGQPNTWPGAAHSSPSCWEVGINQQYVGSSESYLYSPVFSFIGVSNAWIEFWANSNCEFSWDGTRLEYSTDQGITWVTLGTDVELPPIAENWYNDNQLNSSNTYAWMGTSSDITNGASFDWFKAKHNLSMLDNAPDVRFRFVFTSDASVQDEGFAIDDICIKQPQPQDAGITAVVQPAGTAPAGQCLPVIVTIQNYGSQPITSTVVTYVPNGGTPVSHTWTGNLAPGASINDTILPCYATPVGAYSMCAYTSLPGDGDLSNDTTCFSGTGILVLVPSNCDDFEAGNNGGWSQTSTALGAGNFWDLGAPAFGATTGAHSGVNAWDINLGTGYVAGENDTLYSPIYDVSTFPNSNVNMSFWRNNDIVADQDGLWVEYTINGGTTWQTLGSVGDINGVNWYNQTNINFNNQAGWDGFSNGWVKSTYFLNDIISLNTPANIRFRFIFESALFTNGGTGVSMDDFCVTVPCANDVGLLTAGSYNLLQGIALAAGSTDSIQVVLHNYGSSAQTSGVNIFYNVGAGAVGPYAWSGTIPPNGNITITLPVNYTVPSGGFNISAWTVFSGDCEPANDTASSPAVGIPILVPTNCDDFESGNIGWVVAPLGGNNQWQLGTPAFGATTGAHSGTNAWDINLNNAYVPDELDTLFSPIYNVTGLSNSNLSLSFWRNMNTPTNDDGFWLEYTVDGGISWQTLGALADPNSVNWYNQTNLDFSGQVAFDGNTSGWVKSTYFLNDILNAVTPPTIRFRFVFYAAPFGAGGGDGVSIDDFCVTVPCANDLGLFAAQSVNAANGITMAAGSTDSIQVTIHNYGTATQSTFVVWYSINGGTPVSATYTGAAIPPNGNVTFIIPSTYTVPTSQFNITGWVALPGDCEPANDTAHSTAVGVPTLVIDFNNPYCDDFESGNIGWTSSVDVGGDPGSVWELGAPNFGATNTTHSGTNAWDVNLNTQYTNDAIAVLTSPILDLTNAVDTKVDFWQNVQSESNWDGTRMEYRIGGSGPWTVLGTAPCDTSAPGNGVNWYNDNQLNSSQLPGWCINPFNAPCANPTGWFRSIYTLPSACNNQPNVQLRYVFTSDGSVLVDGYSIDDFCVSVPVPLTVTPVSVKKVGPPFIFPGQSIPFEAKIFNDGTSQITSFKATLWIDTQAPTSVDLVSSLTLAPGASIVYPFVNSWIATPGIHQVCVSTELPNGGVDLKPLGDTICTTVQVFDSAVINNSQRCYDFESGAQWVTVNPYDYSPTSSWQQGNAVKLGGPHSPVKAWFTDLASDYVGWDSSALYSPLFVVNGGLTYNLSFWTSFDTERNEDGGTVEYSTDYGITWSQLGNSFDPNWMNTYSITALSPQPPPISAGWSGQSGGWQQVNHDICIPFAGTQNVLFRWRFHSDFSIQAPGWAIDDACFELVQPILTCVVGIDDVKNEFSLVQNSPNPFSDVTTISFSLTDKGYTQLQIVDVTGKVIATPLNSDMSAGNYTVNVNAKELAGGIYFYTLTHNNSQITKKMVVAK